MEKNLIWNPQKKRTVAISALLLFAFQLIVLWCANAFRSDAGRVSFSDHAESSSMTYLRPRPLGRLLQQATSCTESCCQQQFPSTCSSGSSASLSIPFGVQIILIAVLLILSALFSGLTLGIMTLDLTGLEIIMAGDDANNAAFARAIYPVRKNGNLLLCTLLLGNTSVNSLLSILMADKVGGAIGLVSSTFLIVILGEIVPQAACARYPLYVGSRSIPVVHVIVAIFYIVAKPLSWCLDLVLGEELPTIYSNAEMLKLLQIHVQEEMMDHETAITMTGALEFRNRTVQQVMTPLDHVFMLSVDEKLNFETIARIFKAGFSRIPVFEVSKNNVIGLLFVKDLIFLDPDDETRVGDFVGIFGRPVHTVWPDEKLGGVLRELKKGKSHMALVRDVSNKDDSQDPYYELKGIITLEDIIEEILGEEIVDETDAFVDGTHSVKVDREETFKWARLRLLDSKIVDERLSHDETRAVTAHLQKNYPQVVSLLSDNQLYRLVADTNVSILPSAPQKIGELLPSDLLYEKGISTDVSTLVLAGKVTILSGEDNFRFDVSSWCLLAAGALGDPLYKSDFSAYVSTGPCRCIQITRDRFAAAVDASTLERHASPAGSDHGTTEHGINKPRSDPLFLPVTPSLNEGGAWSEKSFGDTTRKGKLLTALQAVDNDIFSAGDRQRGPKITGAKSTEAQNDST